ncbi:MAG: helix-turn-helix domain-containing protein [Pseudomonadota bacterium]
MPKETPPSAREIAAIFASLSQQTRLEAYRLLLRYQPFGLAAGDIARLLSVPHNTLSTHLRALETAGLVRSRKEGRSVIFVASVERYHDAAMFLRLSRGETELSAQATSALNYPSRRPSYESETRSYNVLILCSGNSARSLMAEAIVNRESTGRFRAFSAGSNPKRRAHHQTIEYLEGLGYDTTALKPKSWSKFAEPGAPPLDFVITVCDRAADEKCPSWPGHPLPAHWGIPSMADLANTKEAGRTALQETYRNLMNRFTMFINLDVAKLSLDELKVRIQDIGKIEGATDKALFRIIA